MKYLLNALNENLPKRVDEVTVITKVSCSKGSLIYNYVLNDTDELKMTEFDASQMDTFKKLNLKFLKIIIVATE